MKSQIRITMFIALFGLTGPLAMAQTYNPPNVQLQVKTKINAPAEIVWEILGTQFVDIAVWSNTVQTSKSLEVNEIPVTPYQAAAEAPCLARQTTVENKGKTATLVEIPTEYSDEAMTLRFYGVGLPGFFEFASDRQRVVPLNENECEVIFDLELRVNGVYKVFRGPLKKRFAENLKTVQMDLKTYAEAGQALSVN